MAPQMKRGAANPPVLPPVIPEEDSPKSVAVESPVEETSRLKPTVGHQTVGRRTMAVRSLVALGILALLFGLVVAVTPEGAGRRKESAGSGGEKRPATVASVALRASDLPGGFARCPFSGTIQTYLSKLKFPAPDTYQANLATWNALKGLKAKGGYMAFFSRPRSSCDIVLGKGHGPSEPGHDMDHPSTAFSLVTQYPDADSAVAAFRADVFKQSALLNPRSFNSKRGSRTGLGRNSVVGDAKTGLPYRQAVWQKGTFVVYYGSSNVAFAKAQGAMEAINGRIGSPT